MLQLPGLFGIGSADRDSRRREATTSSSARRRCRWTSRSIWRTRTRTISAKEFKATATLPDGSTKPLLWIQDWDFNWQDGYNYKEPVILPKGTRVDVRITYDNSASNPRNQPSNPPKKVWWGEQSTDEMGSISFGLIPLRREDERRGTSSPGRS